MRKPYLVVVLAVAVLSCYAALTWKRISVKDAGTISLPATWTASDENPQVIENAYGQGVSCRTLLIAYGLNDASLSVLEYWPCSENMLRDFVSGMAETLRRQNGSSSRQQSETIRVGSRVALSATFRATRDYSQKVAAFNEKGKIYCLIATYKSPSEREMQYVVRNIINRWKL